MSAWETAGLALVPAAGCALGGLTSELAPVSKRGVSLALHLAAGVVLGIVAVEVVPRVLGANHPWTMVLAFVGGGLCFLVADAALGLVRGHGRAGGGAHGGPLLIYLAAAIDLAGDGVMIGAASTLAGWQAARLALGLLAADVPAGLATMAALKRGGQSRAARLGLNAAFALAALTGSPWASSG